MRFAAGAGAFERNLGSIPLFTAKRLHRFEQDGLPAGSHLGEFGFQFQRSVEIKSAAIKTVLPGHGGACTRHLKMQGREQQHAVSQSEYSLELRRNGHCGRLWSELWFPQASQAQSIDFGLQLIIREKAIADVK